MAERKNKAIPILIGAGIAVALFATTVFAKKPVPGLGAEITNVEVS